MKKNYIFAFLLFVSLFVEAQTNLVPNGGVENWTDATTLDDWTTENNVSQNTTDVVEGSSSATLTIGADDIRPKILAKVPMEMNVEYNVSYRFKYVDSNFGGTHPVSLRIIRSGSATTISSNRFASNNNWIEVSTTFTPDQTGDYDLSISTATFDSEGFTVLIDDVKVFDPNDNSNDIVDIPDANFKNALLNHSPILDTSGDGEIQVFEAEAFTGFLNVFHKNISDLTGIEAFVNITKLLCSENDLNQLDVSKNTELIDLSCYKNNLTTLDLSNNTQLTSILCFENQLSVLDLSVNTQLTSIGCSRNNLASLIIPNNNKLRAIVCNFNNLTSLDTSNSIGLEELHCFVNKLETLDLSNNPELNYLSCSSNNLTSLNTSNNTKLNFLSCSENQFSSLDLTNNVVLAQLNCRENNISSLDVTNNVELFEFTCSDNEITNLDLSNSSKLRFFSCDDNNLTNLDLSKSIGLERLTCSANDLRSLNVANGNNTNLNIVTSSNSNLYCVTVDDEDYSNANWISKDAHTSFSNDCSLVSNLFIEESPNGTIVVNPSSDNGLYSNGTEVTITANPNYEYVFEGWSGDITGTENPITIIMDVDKKVEPIFSKVKYIVTKNAVNGSISIDPFDSNDAYESGSVVRLFAAPDFGYQFDGWSDDVSGDQNPLPITVNENKTVTALFSKIQQTLTTNAPNGTITRNPSTPASGTYDFESSVELTAIPDEGYQFEHWAGDVFGSFNPTSIVMDGDKTVHAVFSRIQYSLSVNTTQASIEINPDNPSTGKYDSDTEVQVTIIPDNGYQFERWEGDVTGTDNPLTIKMDSDKNITAIISEVSNLDITTFASGFTGLEGIAINSNNEVFVSEHGSGKMYSIDATGTTTEFASSGFRLNDIVFNKNDELYVAQDFIYKILIADSSGNLTTYLDNLPNTPYGVTFYNNELYYTSGFGGNVYRVDASGAEAMYSSGFFSTEGIDFDSNGNAYVADKNDRKLFKITPDGTKTELVSGIERINGVVVVNDIVYFTTYTSSSDKVVKYDPIANTTEDYVTSGLNAPSNLEVDKLGNMYITNGGNGTVTKVFDEDLKPNTATTSINDEEFNSKLIVSPNPVKDLITIKSNDFAAIKEIEIVDLLGKEILKTKETSISVSHLPKGMYLLKIKSENNRVGVKKFIKE